MSRVETLIERRPRVDKTHQLLFDHLPEVLNTALINRGISSATELDFSLQGLLPPNLKGLDQAVMLLEQAIETQARIVIVGDFDADGATSCAVLMRGLAALGHHDVQFIVPNRFDYGYGLTPEIVDLAQAMSPKLIVTVDNGISSIEGVKKAKLLGIKVLITDHHLPGSELPQADAIVNPNQPDCHFQSKNLAGVGVAFYLLLALRASLRLKDFFKTQPEPNLAELLDLVALGTVADVVPLDKNNRILVEQGLRRIRAGKACVGINALVNVAGRDVTRISASDIGFVLGPRLNAAGRLDDISIGIAALLTDDQQLAFDIAQELDNFNKDRRSIEQGMKDEAERMLAAINTENLPTGVCLYHRNWHQGVVGILASRIKENYHRPTICFAKANDDESCDDLKGSARSIAGLHIRDVLDFVATQHPGLIHKFGGHAMAAGLSLSVDNFKAFAEAFNRAVNMALGESSLQKTLLSDGELGASYLSLELAEKIKWAFPWGQSFPEPVFDEAFLIRSQRLVGEKHLKLTLAKKELPSIEWDAIAFNIDTDQWPDTAISHVHLAYALDVNEFRGVKKLQLLVKDIKKITVEK